MIFNIEFLKSKLNYFSVIGSILYGFFCASNPTPEVIAVIGYVAYFLCAALFFFAICIWWTSYNWKQKLKGFLIFTLCLILMSNSAIYVYMKINGVLYKDAQEIIAVWFSNFLYYLPFLP